MSDPVVQPGVPVEKLVALTPPRYDLGTDAPLTAGVQNVEDEQGNPSALYLGPNFAGVGGPAPASGAATARLQVQGTPGYNSLLSVYNSASSGPSEASIHFSNATDGGAWWHTGVGGNAGPMRFFIWNSVQGLALKVDPNGDTTVTGTISARSINGATTGLTGLPPVGSAPPSANLASVVVDTNTGKLYAL